MFCVLVLIALSQSAPSWAAQVSVSAAVPVPLSERVSFEGPSPHKDPLEPCTDTSSGRPLEGMCLPMHQCPSAMAAYTTWASLPITCGFKGVTRIVCCVHEGPDVSPSPVIDISAPTVDFGCVKSDASRKREGARGPVAFGVGGVSSQLNAWPWMALLGWRSADGSMAWRCGGTLINLRWVVTAAHCFDQSDPQVVRLGEHDYSNDTDGALHEDFGISRIVFHPDYSVKEAYHDIALVQLDVPVQLKKGIKPACLPWGDESFKDLENLPVSLTGWGATEYGGVQSPVLQVVPLQILSSSVCNSNYRNLPSFDLNFPRGIQMDDFVCAGDEAGGKDACKGDSGGPISYFSSEKRGYILAGVVAKGYGCGLAEYPGLYTPLHNRDYLSWIKTTSFA